MQGLEQLRLELCTSQVWKKGRFEEKRLTVCRRARTLIVGWKPHTNTRWCSMVSSCASFATRRTSSTSYDGKEYSRRVAMKASTLWLPNATLARSRNRHPMGVTANNTAASVASAAARLQDRSSRERRPRSKREKP